MSKIDIGIKDKDRKAIADGLSRLLADTYTLYLKTHNFHWNVTGPMFQTLHLMFETQYNELALAVDLVAERIRALGYPAPGTYNQYAKLSSIKETSGVPKATDMIELLVEGQEAVVRTARSIFPLASSTPSLTASQPHALFSSTFATHMGSTPGTSPAHSTCRWSTSRSWPTAC